MKALTDRYERVVDVVWYDLRPLWLVSLSVLFFWLAAAEC
jgi:hypothetical protein